LGLTRRRLNRMLLLLESLGSSCLLCFDLLVGCGYVKRPHEIDRALLWKKTVRK